MDCYANEARMFLFQHNNLTQRIGIMEISIFRMESDYQIDR